MGFHKCRKEGCGFRLPDNYPFPYCPWHTSKAGVKAAVAVVGLAAGAVGWLLSKLNRQSNAKTEEQREREQREMERARWRVESKRRRDGKTKLAEGLSDSEDDLKTG